MRWLLTILVASLLLGYCPPAEAQVESPEARQIRAQLEELQQRLEQITRRGGDRRVTEIGSSTGRARFDGEPRLLVRIYDISDLFSIAPSYVAREPGDLQQTARAIFPETELAAKTRGGVGGGGFGGMGGMFSVPDSLDRGMAEQRATLHQAAGAVGGMPADSGRTSVDDLIDTITTTIAPDEWDDVGGPATIKALGASLVISASIDTHDKVAALIDLFRSRWGSLRTVSLEAHWLWLPEAELTAALAPRPENDAPADEPPAFGVLSADGWQALREAARPGGYHAVVTCYNGQTVYALSGGQRSIVSGITPVVGGEAAAYAPEIRIVQEGAALQATPVVTRTAKYVVADIHSRVNLLQGPADKLAEAAPRRGPLPLASGPAEVVAALDRPVLQSQRLSTTLRIPVGQPMLIGGMTFSGGADDANLYLFLTARVQELRDDETAEPDEPAAAEPEKGEEPDLPPEQQGN